MNVFLSGKLTFAAVEANYFLIEVALEKGFVSLTLKWTLFLPAHLRRLLWLS